MIIILFSTIQYTSYPAISTVFISYKLFYISLQPIMVIQYFSLLFKRESGWNPEQCPLL